MRKILGVHCGHDSAAALVIDGQIVADAAEERFTRVKNDSSFPLNAIQFCLEYADIDPSDIDALAIPSIYMRDSIRTFFDIPEEVLPAERRPLKSRLKRGLLDLVPSLKSGTTTLPLYQKPIPLSKRCQIFLIDHHKAHAASAYYTSGLNTELTLVVTMDGAGDTTSLCIWKGEKNRLTPLEQWGPDASLGWFYSNCTEALDWRHGSDEWKVMGLAPYGTPKPGALKGFHPEFKDGQLIIPHRYGKSGSWLDHGAYHFHFDEARELRQIAERLGRDNFAAETQRVFEEQVDNIILPWLSRLNTRHFCGAGGSFLNVKANQKIWYSRKLDTHWVYPNPGDAGLAVGAALCAYYERYPEARHDYLQHVYFGPEYSNEYIQKLLDERGIEYEYAENPSVVAAKYLAANKIIGWFQGRMESGPRALGNRSILMSPLRAENKDIINACVKYRERFRPFCPSLLYEKSNDYLVNGRDERFMITSFDVVPEKREKIPAVVHVDKTARPQMVCREINSWYYDLIKAFGDMTGEYVILNTSFNIKGEPIVCHPREAIRCFYDTGLDVLIMGNCVISKKRTIHKL
jgi:carbamoyltransferase